VSIGGGKWEDVEETVRIVRVPCRFGGARPYFICPGAANGISCGRRVAKLHAAGRYFLCRHCYRLAHASQSESRWEALPYFVGAPQCPISPVWPPRSRRSPKGMHRRTYDRLQEKVYEAEMLANERLAFIVARLTNAENRTHRPSRARRHKEFWE
jgi:hypothetical protein